MKISVLWKAPELNPKDLKAKSIPILNPINIYGRCFNLSWLAFFVCFLSWFAFPPLMHGSISKDLKLTAVDVANNNIVGLCATLMARFFLGPIIDKVGPRIAMASILFIGAIPTAFVPLVNNLSGLHAIRFFIGILGGSFIPCQMWTTVFFDKNIIGTANALAGGWGNAGGGVAFFVMPQIFADLMGDGYSLSRSWKLAFTIGPFIILMFVAALVFFFGQDCPEGKWSQRKDVLGLGVDNSLVTVVSVSNGANVDEKTKQRQITLQLSNNGTGENNLHATESVVLQKSVSHQTKNNIDSNLNPNDSNSVDIPIEDLINKDEIIEDPTVWTTLKYCFHYRTMLCALPYAITFGGELAVESILSGLYTQVHPEWSQVEAGRWGSMMGLLNVVIRPLGGFISDLLYRKFKTTKAKKFWCLFCGFMQGVFLLWIGLVPSLKIHSLIAALMIMCVFMEMGNGANYGFVYFVNKKHPGIVAGSTGAFGNIGGVLFSLVFRYNVVNGKTNYFRSFWIIGICSMATTALCTLIPLREEVPELGEKEKEIIATDLESNSNGSFSCEKN
ncbi:unnamed protein product [[Candida] boidinii]|nr:unnamed protein product [[Candida] boidinii]